jgi:hypothetical protein
MKAWYPTDNQDRFTENDKQIDQEAVYFPENDKPNTNLKDSSYTDILMKILKRYFQLIKKVNVLGKMKVKYKLILGVLYGHVAILVYGVAAVKVVWVLIQ